MVQIEMAMTVKLTREDFCRHEPKCECKEWMYVTVPDYRTYHKAYDWLKHERKFKFIPAEGVYEEGTRHTGAFRFRFLCEQEYLWFKLRWS